MRVSSGKSLRSRRFDCRSACGQGPHERPESAQATKPRTRLSKSGPLLPSKVIRADMPGGRGVPFPDSGTAQMASLFGQTLERDHQYELSPIDIPAMADGSRQLF